MGALKYVEELQKKKQSDILRFLLRVRCWEVCWKIFLPSDTNGTRKIYNHDTIGLDDYVDAVFSRRLYGKRECLCYTLVEQ